jgi:hypothetical protein
MPRVLFALGALIALAVAPAAAQYAETPEPLTTTPSMLGPTGALITPTTDISDRSYSIGYHWLNDTFDALAKLNISPIDRFEVGVTWVDPDSATVDDETVFHAKYLLAEEDDDSPALTVGVWDVSDELDQTWYAVVSKEIEGEIPVIINLGGATGDIINGFFANATLRLTEDLDFLLEYDSEEVNFGLRARPYEGITLDVLSVDNGVDREFGVGASYSAAW